MAITATRTATAAARATKTTTAATTAATRATTLTTLRLLFVFRPSTEVFIPFSLQRVTRRKLAID